VPSAGRSVRGILVLAFAGAGLARGWAADETKLLLSFEDDAALLACDGSATRQLVPDNATDGGQALRVDLTEPTPILALRAGDEPFDFTGWEKVQLDAYREGPPITWNLRVRDRKGSSYTAWYYLLRPGPNVVEYSVPGMASVLDVSQVDTLSFFTETRSGKIDIDNVRLSGSANDGSWLLRKAPPKPVVQAAGNLIGNGDFELGMQNWGSWGQWDGGLYWFGCGTGDDAYSGGASAAIICQRRGRGGIFLSPGAQFRLSPGTYRLTYYAKGSTPDVRMFWQFEGGGREGGGLADAIPKGYRGERVDVAQQWTKYEQEVEVTRDAGPLAVYFYSVGGGTLFLDAVSLVRQDAEAEQPPPPRDLKPSKVELRGTVTYVNGQPFFPVGFYNADPDALKGTGFNFICRDPGPGAPGLEFLDRCQANGIMVTANLEGVMRAHVPWQAPEAIEELQRHPAVFGWYVCDEPDHAQWTVAPPEMRLATRLLHEADPNHPTWTVVMPWADSNIYQYADTVDIIGTDMYPIADYDRKVLEVARATDTMRRSVKGERPVWMVTEATAKATPEEEYAITYLALTHGANGIIYWVFDDAHGSPEIWETMVKISLELKELTPALVSPSAADQPTAANPNIHCLAKQPKGQLVLLTVNASSEAQPAVQITLPGIAEQTARVLFEDRTVSLERGRLTDEFGPYERHVYVLP